MKQSKHLVDDLFVDRARQLPPPAYGPAQQGGVALLSFAYGLADPALFPREELAEASAAVLAEDADAALNYGPAYAGLREQIVARLRAEGIAAEDEQILVSYGSSQILGLLPRVFIDPGDV